MPRLRLVVLLAAWAATGCAPAPSATGLTDADRAAIDAVIAEDARAVRASDYDALTALYAPDATRMPPNQPAISGRDAIGAWHRQIGTVESFSFTLVELDGRGDLAWFRGNYTLAVVPPGADRAIADTGKVVGILRKQADGSWLNVADIWNSDLPVGP